MLFIFRELGSICNCFQGFGGQAHTFLDIIGSPAKKKKKTHLKEKAFISFDFFQKKSSASGGGGGPEPPCMAKCNYVRANMLILTGIGD